MPTKNITDIEYKTFRDYLEKQCGIVLGDNKQYLVKSRLAPVLTKYKIKSLTELLSSLSSISQRELRAAVIDAMTTNETLWFRDGYPFELLKSKIFPDFHGQRKPIRMWSAACSSGQEPYSLSMTSLEYQMQRPGTLPGGVEILATDISASMLEQCKGAEYDELALARGLSPERRRQFFEKADSGRFRLNSKVRQQVTFRYANLLESYALLGRFDIIFCRNVLIYFSADVKSKIINQFAGALNPGGYLMLGASESISGLSDKFEMVRCNPGIVYKVIK
ncbi:CheR family methyltransferase [Echinimonas agarilytica]|uniref:protein-glutamate O-methyltransferase n=1 Tax=Echinimonas agarilytica TaxID=1215918 RepID=A0AA41W4R4_9GAMM|nr:protein-glutamate O-methyltransferase CheR [Echinimonas agarilytica]